MKNRSIWTTAHLAFWHIITQEHNLDLVAYISKHMKFKWLREVKSKEKMLMNFRKKGYSGIIPFVYEGKEEIHKYLQY